MFDGGDLRLTMTTCTDEEMETLSLSSTTPGPSSGPGSSAALPPPASAAVAESPTPVTKRPTYDSDSADDGASIGGYGDHVGSGEDMWDPISSFSAWFRSPIQEGARHSQRAPTDGRSGSGTP